MTEMPENDNEDTKVTELETEETSAVTGGVGGSNSGSYPLDDSESSSVPTT